MADVRNGRSNCSRDAKTHHMFFIAFLLDKVSFDF